jgi:hypothetical protein
MKLLCLGAVLSTAVISLLGFQTRAIAQEPDYVCFMITKSGQVMDLTEPLCGLDKSAPVVSANSNKAYTDNSDQEYQEFIENYEQALHNQGMIRTKRVTRDYSGILNQTSMDR